MLSSLLPGLRDFRTPFVTGTLYLFLAWSVAGYRLQGTAQQTYFGTRASEVASVLGASAMIAVAGFGAYLVGSLLEIATLPRRLFTRYEHDPYATVSLLESRIEGFVRTLNWPDTDATMQVELDRLGLGPEFASDLRGAIESTIEGDLEIFVGREGKNVHLLDDSPISELRGRVDPPALRARLVEAMKNELTERANGTVTALQIGHESLFQDYDRLRSEASLRFSIFPPLAGIVLLAAISWHWTGLFAMVVPIALIYKGYRKQAAADRLIWQAVASGAVEPPEFDQIRKSLSASRQSSHSSDA